MQKQEEYNMQNTLPTPPQGTAADILNNVIAQSANSSAISALKPPAGVVNTEEQGIADSETKEGKDSQKTTAELFVESLPPHEQTLYKHISREMIKKQKLSILMVTGELTFTYEFKGITMEFSLLDGKDKYAVDQYQYGRDPLNIFKADI